MKKVLFIITKSNWGGAQRYVYDLATSLSKDDFEISVAFGGTGLPRADIGKLHEKLTETGIRTLKLKYFSRDIYPIFDIQAFLELIKLLRTEHPDILHLNSSKAGGLGAVVGRITNIPQIIFTSHGLAYDEDRPHLIKLLIFFFSWLTFIFVHKTIMVTQDTYNRTVTLPFLRKKIFLIHNGILPLSFLEKEEAKSSLLLKSKLDHFSSEGFKDDWIGTVSELTKNKGLDYLLEASLLLKKQGALFSLFIIGHIESEKLRNDFFIKIMKMGLSKNVFLLGFIPDAYRYLKAFDIFTLSSVKEGLPYVLLEAGLAKRPVISSNVGGIPDIIENKKTGILITPKAPEQLADAITLFVKNKDVREKMGLTLCKKVEIEFSQEKMLKKTALLYLNS